jgi:hypothetical protein
MGELRTGLVFDCRMGSVELVNGVGDMGEEGFMMRGGFGL